MPFVCLTFLLIASNLAVGALFSLTNNRYRIMCLCFCLYITESQKTFPHHLLLHVCPGLTFAKSNLVRKYQNITSTTSLLDRWKHLGTPHFYLDSNPISSTLLCNWSENVKKSSKVNVHVYGSSIWVTMLLKVHWRYNLCISERVSELNLYASLNFNP